jgi:hypothetical protein
MSEQTTDRTCRKTDKEKLRPTPTQERALEQVLWLPRQWNRSPDCGYS